MKRIGLHFPRLFKILLWGILLTSFFTGLTWFYLHRWGLVRGEFGEEPNAWEPFLMKVHGAMATLMSVFFGYLLGTHLTIAWRAKRNRVLGATVIGLISSMIVTGYALYYCGDEGLRSITSWSHVIIGISLPITLLAHIWAGHKRSSS